MEPLHELAHQLRHGMAEAVMGIPLTPTPIWPKVSKECLTQFNSYVLVLHKQVWVDFDHHSLAFSALQCDHRDLPGRPLLVISELRVQLGLPGVQPVSLLTC